MKTSQKFLLAICLLITSLISMAQQQLHEHLFPLSSVELLDGPFKKSMELNIEHLLKYDVDRLLEPFLKEAGITPKGSPFVNWDGLAGHVGGHYLSAMAMHYAASGNQECKSRMDYMITQLKACQDKNGNGYVGGVPNSRNVWMSLSNGDFGPFYSAWVPWYNLHKTYAGLRDAYIYGGNEASRQMFLNLCDWGIGTIGNLSDAQIQTILDVEFGGMNEVYADAYKLTGETKYLEAAKRFTHHLLFDAFVGNFDNLDNKHANTQIPKFVGFASVGAYDAAATSYRTAAANFWDAVVNNRSLALGGNSRREFFPAAADASDYIHDREGPESCNTYNMLKLSSDLHEMTPSVKYADFYEKALFNHILSTQHPEHGGYVYFTPVRPMHYRVYSAPNQAMWCCVGTGMENHGKHGEFIYSHDGDQLFVNLFIASKLNWAEKGMTVTQETSFPYEPTTKLTIGGSGLIHFKLRYPEWVKEGEMGLLLNGNPFPVLAKPGEYINLKTTWSDGDVIELKMPMHLAYEELAHLTEYKAFMFGPVLLGAKTSHTDLNGLVANDGRWSHIASGSLIGAFDAPVVISEPQTLLEKIKPVEGKPLTFSAAELLPGQEKFKNLTLEPFSGIHDSRYMMYWLTLKPADAEQYIADLKAIEKERLILDARTVDQISTGEQQPESDHRIQSANSFTGIHENEYWRDVRSGGFLSYEMATGGLTDLNLSVRYWGSETGSRVFDILIDDDVIKRENVVGKWNVQDFVDEEYIIDPTLLEGKDFVTVKFQPVSGSVAGGFFYIRLVKKSLNDDANLKEIKLGGVDLSGFQTDKFSYEITLDGQTIPYITAASSDENAHVEIVYSDSSNMVQIIVTAEDYEMVNTYELSFILKPLTIDHLTGISLYPNPAKDIVHIQGLISDNAIVMIYNLSGELIYNQRLGRKSNLIDIAGLSHGVYVIYVLDGSHTSEVRLIKQ